MKKRILSVFAAFAVMLSLSACKSGETGQEIENSEVTKQVVETSETSITTKTGSETSLLIEGITKANEVLTEIESTEEVETLIIAGSKYDINTESIRLYESSITNEDIQQLTRLKNLKELSIDLYSEKPDITDLSVLSELKSVEKLYINGTYSDLSFIDGMKNLQSITLEHFFCETLENVPQNTTVTSLAFSQSEISDISMISNYKKLEKICLGHFCCDDFSPIGEVENLKELSMFMIENNNVDLRFLEKLTLIEYFSYYTVNGTSNFDAISKCTQLTYLEIYADIDNFNFVSQLSNLQTFSFCANNYNLFDITVLENCKKLKNVQLTCEYLEEALDGLKKVLNDCEFK